MRDKLGFEIPAAIEELWKEADRVGRDLCERMHKIKLEVEKGVKERDPIYREITQSTVIDLDYIWRTLKQIIPYAVCPMCEADERRHECRGCSGAGFVSKFRYEKAIPRNVKEPRLQRLAIAEAS